MHASVRLMVGVPSAGAGTWFVAATGTTDDAGSFTLAYVIPSSYWAAHGEMCPRRALEHSRKLDARWECGTGNCPMPVHKIPGCMTRPAR